MNRIEAFVTQFRYPNTLAVALLICAVMAVLVMCGCHSASSTVACVPHCLDNNQLDNCERIIPCSQWGRVCGYDSRDGESDCVNP